MRYGDVSRRLIFGKSRLTFVHEDSAHPQTLVSLNACESWHLITGRQVCRLAFTTRRASLAANGGRNQTCHSLRAIHNSVTAPLRVGNHMTALSTVRSTCRRIRRLRA